MWLQMTFTWHAHDTPMARVSSVSMAECPCISVSMCNRSEGVTNGNPLATTVVNNQLEPLRYCWYKIITYMHMGIQNTLHTESHIYIYMIVYIYIYYYKNHHWASEGAHAHTHAHTHIYIYTYIHIYIYIYIICIYTYHIYIYRHTCI